MAAAAATRGSKRAAFVASSFTKSNAFLIIAAEAASAPKANAKGTAAVAIAAKPLAAPEAALATPAPARLADAAAAARLKADETLAPARAYFPLRKLLVASSSNACFQEGPVYSFLLRWLSGTGGGSRLGMGGGDAPARRPESAAAVLEA